MSNWITVGTYESRLDAEVGKSLLESNGIPAQIASDDLGGMRPSLTVLHGVQLKVKEERAKEALELLKEV